VKIEKIVAVIDCGTAVNPDNVKAQVEGATVMALTAALKDEITFEGGKPVQRNFDRYRMLRINEVPPIEVHLVAGREKPDGVGEPGLPPLAPALGNAIFAATGKRVRKLPLDISRIS
jgi:isoquinoline 1-oxidoreductase beta subunit